MNILVITDLYPISENEKNTPKTIYNFVQEWKKLGHSVKVIKPNFIFNSFLRSKPFYKTKIYGDVENINYFLPFWGNIKNKMKSDINEFDAVIAHMPSGIIFANKLKLDIPLITGVHVSDIEVLTNPIYSIYFKREMEKAYKKASKIACRSEVLKRKFLKLYPEYESKTFVAYSGTEIEPIRRNWQNKDKYRIITCANLIKRKNIDKVIDACAEIKNVELIVIGDGKEMNRLKNLASKNPQITFSGHLSHKSVIEEMKRADIFILPSINETFGMVYLEAMACGCITIGLENDGIDGILKNGENGYLCNLDNIKETIENIILSNTQNQILENSYKTIKNYTNKNAGINYLEKSCLNINQQQKKL